MATQIISSGKRYEPTTINLPAGLKTQVKAAGIVMSATLKKALVTELDARGYAVNEEWR